MIYMAQWSVDSSIHEQDETMNSNLLLRVIDQTPVGSTAQEARAMSPPEEEDEASLLVRKEKRRELNRKKLPLGALLLEHVGVCNFSTNRRY